MDEKTAPMYLFITADQNTSPEEINLLTQELGKALAQSQGEVADVRLVGRDQLPQGTKMPELIFAEQAVIQLIPIVAPWVLGKIDALVKSFSEGRQKPIKTTVQVGSREIHIGPETTSQELAQYKEIVKSTETLTNKRFALVIGNSIFTDAKLPPLNSADADAKMFADVLTDERIGAFDKVTTLINKDSFTILTSIEAFFQNRQKDDLLVLYFSGHGIKSNSGQLFLAAQNTAVDLVRSTGVPSSFIKENMDTSQSQRQVLILDCCYSGSMVEGAKGEQVIGQSANSVLAFQTSGFGRVIMAASEAMQYAYDGQHFEGRTENSLFTHYLIEGLRTGKADYDNDGLINVDELYQYAYSCVVPKQTPNISTQSQKGKMYISINPNPTIQPAELPANLKAALKSDDRLYKQGAIMELKALLNDADSRKSIAAEMALKELLRDDSHAIRQLAQEALRRPQVISQPKANQPPVIQIPQPRAVPQPPAASQPAVAVPQNPVPQGSVKTGPVAALGGQGIPLPRVGARPPAPVMAPAQSAETIPAAPAQAVQPASKPSPIFTAILSLVLLGGAGQVAVKQYKKGLALMAGMIIVFIISISLFFIPYVLALSICAGDAYGTAKKIAKGSPVRDWEFNINWKATGVIFLIVFVLFIACSLVI